MPTMRTTKTTRTSTRPKAARAREGQEKAMMALTAADQRAYFGPLFFMQHLRGLVRDRCPEPADGIPSVQIHLMDGEALDVCHIIGVAPGWIALAVHEEAMSDRPSQLRTELVPYPVIARISIQTTRHEGAHPIGFNATSEPALYGSISSGAAMTPEDALRALAGTPVTAAASKAPTASPTATPTASPTATKKRQSEPPTGSARRSR